MLYDIIIIGGGMVGASLACALRNSPLQIALVDATPLSTHDDPRLIALNDSSYCLFNNLSIWPTLEAHAAPIKQVHVSDRGQFGMMRLHADEQGLSALGYVVPAKNINAGLYEVLASSTTAENRDGKITIFRPAKLKQLVSADNHATVVLETESGEIKLEGKYIIGADGTHSTVREQLDIDIESEENQQSALVTITELQRPHHDIAYERFHPGGAVAMLPLIGNRCATIWTDSNTIIQGLLALDDATFLTTLQKQFGYRLGRLLKIGKRHHYPLLLVRAKQTRKHNVILIGNAAHTFHPIAAQGLNLALSEIAMLAQIIHEQPAHPNWPSFLAWQQQQQDNSMRLSHQLPRLYAKDFSLLNLARQAGMIGVDICPPLKKRFTQHAMGKKGSVPQLLLDKNRHEIDKQ